MTDRSPRTEGDLSDFIALRHDEGATVTAAPDDTWPRSLPAWLAMTSPSCRFWRMATWSASSVSGFDPPYKGDRQRFSLPVSEAMSRYVRKPLDKHAPESEPQAISIAVWWR